MRTTVQGPCAALGLALALPLGGLAALGPAGTAGSPSPPSPVVAAATPSPRPSAPARRSAAPAVVARGDGRPVVVPGQSAVAGTGALRRYAVAVEGGLRVDPRAFAAAVDRTLADPRSWGAGGRLSFRRVDRGPVSFRVVLASPETTDRLCVPLHTGGTYSCGNGSAAVINASRWLRGASSYTGDLARYRQYVVNHEVGHVLGHGHERCPRAGAPAPVMVQQTKGLDGCARNPWPFP